MAVDLSALKDKNKLTLKNKLKKLHKIWLIEV